MSPLKKTASGSTYYDTIPHASFNISAAPEPAGHEPAPINEKESIELFDIRAVRLERLSPHCFKEGGWGQVVGVAVTTERFVLGRYARPLLERLGLPDHAALVVGDAIDDGPEDYQFT